MYVTPVGMRGQALSTITSSETDLMSIILASYPSKLLDQPLKVFSEFEMAYVWYYFCN